MPASTIASIDTIALRIPLDTWAPPPQFAGKPRTHVETHAGARRRPAGGVVGWGEAYGIELAADPRGVRQLDQAFAVGQDADRQGA